MEKETKSCKYCGAIVTENSVFCNTCGKRLDGDSVLFTTLDIKKFINIINIVLSFVIVLFGFVSLAFCLVKASVIGIVDVSLSGYEVIVDNNLITGEEQVWFSISGIIHIVATVVLSIFLGYSFVSKGATEPVMHFVCILSIVLAIIFLINGIIASAQVKDQVEIIIKELEVKSDAHIKITTVSFVPFIIQAVLYIIFLLNEIYLKRIK